VFSSLYTYAICDAISVYIYIFVFSQHGRVTIACTRGTLAFFLIFFLQVLFTTSTRDDRVHPGHARKMVRALQEEAKESAPVVLYWENIEGSTCSFFLFAKWYACCRRRPWRLRLWSVTGKTCKVLSLLFSRSRSRSRALYLARALSLARSLSLRPSLSLSLVSSVCARSLSSVCARSLSVGAHRCMRVWMCLCAHVCMCVCVFVLRMCMCVCVCVCVAQADTEGLRTINRRPTCGH
jgi:hypothetical protein